MIADRHRPLRALLRGAGMAIGPDRVLAALAAVELVGPQRRDDVHAALGAVMLERHEQQPLFDAAFDSFWSDPQSLQRPLSLLQEPGGDVTHRPPQTHRLAEALAAARQGEAPPNDGASDERSVRCTASAPASASDCTGQISKA